jgi:hypothetical protein
VESPLRGNTHGGFGERPGETDRWQHRHRAPGRLNQLWLWNDWPGGLLAIAHRQGYVLGAVSGMPWAGGLLLTWCRHQDPKLRSVLYRIGLARTFPREVGRPRVPGHLLGVAVRTAVGASLPT